MVRLTLLTLAVVSLMPTAPFGCPPTTPPDDGTPPADSATIDTTIDAPQSAVAGESVTLTARTAGAPDGSQMFYDWLQIAGPGVSLADRDQPTAKFTAPSLEFDGRITILVVTRDASGAAGEAAASIDIVADPNFSPYDWGDVSGGGATGSTSPVANAGSDVRSDPGDTVTLDGTGSSGQGLRYRWRQVSGTTVELTGADTAQATLTVPDYIPDSDENTLVFELTVTDEANRTTSDRTKVVISNPDVSDTRVVVETSRGTFKILLYPEEAPITVENFLQYVDDGFYDGTIFHRVIAGFVVQGGGFEPGLVRKETRDTIVLEADNGLKNLRGTVAMARTNEPDSATSQWFVNLVDNDFLDYAPDNPGYAVFGEVYEGMDVVDQIAAVQTGEVSGFQDVPLNDVTIISVTRAAAE